MESMLMTGSGLIDADRAFTRAARRRRSAALRRRLRGASRCLDRLRVYADCELGRRRALGGRGISEVPLDAIGGTVEPARATLFDSTFQPTRAARERWQRLWLAEHRGAALPPVVLVPVDDGYAVRDGHHRI